MTIGQKDPTSNFNLNLILILHLGHFLLHGESWSQDAKHTITRTIGLESEGSYSLIRLLLKESNYKPSLNVLEVRTVLSQAYLTTFALGILWNVRTGFLERKRKGGGPTPRREREHLWLPWGGYGEYMYNRFYMIGWA